MLFVTALLLLGAFLSPPPLSATICVKGEPLLLHRVRGVVLSQDYGRDETRVGLLPGVTVMLKRGEFESITVSDEDGYFSFPELPIGDYQLSTDFEGFAEARGEVRIRRHADRNDMLVIDIQPYVGYCSGISKKTWQAARRLQERGRQSMRQP
jgi:hypothetical protein